MVVHETVGPYLIFTAVAPICHQIEIFSIIGVRKKVKRGLSPIESQTVRFIAVAASFFPGENGENFGSLELVGLFCQFF